MVVGQAGTEEVTGGELRGGRWFGSKGGFRLWWSLVEAEALGSSARLWGDVWWRWMHGGGPGCDELLQSSAAVELAGDEEESPSSSIAGYGSAMGMAWVCLSARLSSGSPFIARQGWLRGGG